ncbi:hypothetical protein LCGC14_2670180, partial [marine sediment metagenome]
MLGLKKKIALLQLISGTLVLESSGMDLLYNIIKNNSIEEL